jgi:hypothetical protein
VGQGGRIFPQEMNSTTTPRLAGAKRSAIETMEEYNYEFILATIPAILFIITMPLGIGRPTRPTRTTTRLPRVRTRVPLPVLPFNPSQIADELEVATQSLGNPGRMMLAAARRLTEMRHLSATQKVEVILEFFRRIGFTIRGPVQVTSEYFQIISEDGIYAFKFMKETGQIIYGKFDMAAMDYIWRTL